MSQRTYEKEHLKKITNIIREEIKLLEERKTLILKKIANFKFKLASRARP